ncbi:MAG: hypothetical protein NTV48_02380 [Candidatus Vogelbacteria bacterium]|nr:hypothetical protein [Candidatus Vogelbacteria bacterium]
MSKTSCQKTCYRGIVKMDFEQGVRVVSKNGRNGKGEMAMVMRNLRPFGLEETTGMDSVSRDSRELAILIPSLTSRTGSGQFDFLSRHRQIRPDEWDGGRCFDEAPKRKSL